LLQIRMKLSVIIPVYNERNTIETLLSKVRKITVDKLQKEIVVVDDNSTDGTTKILKAASQDGIKVISHDQNRGKGAAVLTGIKKATGDIIIIQDGDLEYDPKDYPALVKPIIDGKSDVVYGRRTLGGSNRPYWSTGWETSC
jgi:glycosyltransferase involved in cell wall biosynthesis